MASEPATESIANRVAQSLAAFEAIDTVETQSQPGDSQFVWVQTIGDQLSKFKLWAGNIGAHRTGRSSLDYRLRDSSHLHTQVMRLLGDLIASLNEVYAILSGETLPWDQDLEEADELDEELKDLLMNEDFEFNSELGQLTNEITDTVGNLLRLSISLRNPAPHDRFMSTEYAKVHYFEANDIAHVEAKFPSASQTLIIRLGQALSQRRQYFKYRESHHEKLARGLFDSGRSEAGAQSTVASSIPIAMTVPGAVPVFGELDEDERSDTGFSQTSFATSAPESDHLRIPPLLKRAYDGPFECPFCFMLISVSSTHQWKKHVLRDLRPYICLDEDCATASREYGRRHEWMDHIFQKHWKSWACPYQCGLESTAETNLRQHITRIHGSKTEMELDAMIARCGRTRSISPSSPVECPLCQDALESVQQYQRHVGRHQVDLSLFALPRIEDDDAELDGTNEDHETLSTRSGSYSEAMSGDISPTALPVPGVSIIGIDEIGEVHESEIIDNEPERQESEWFTDDRDDVVIRIRERETHRSQDLDGLVQAERSNMRDPGFVDKLDDVRRELGVVHPPDSPEEQAPAPLIADRIYGESDPEYDEADGRTTSHRQHNSRALPSFSREREVARKEYDLERAQKEPEEDKRRRNKHKRIQREFEGYQKRREILQKVLEEDPKHREFVQKIFEEDPGRREMAQKLLEEERNRRELVQKILEQDQRHHEMAQKFEADLRNHEMAQKMLEEDPIRHEIAQRILEQDRKHHEMVQDILEDDLTRREEYERMEKEFEEVLNA